MYRYHVVVLPPRQRLGVAQANVLEAASRKEVDLGPAAEEGNAVRHAKAVHPLDIALERRRAETEALESRADGHRVDANRPAIGPVADGLAGIDRPAVQNLHPVPGAGHVSVRHDGAAA